MSRLNWPCAWIHPFSEPSFGSPCQATFLQPISHETHFILPTTAWRYYASWFLSGSYFIEQPIRFVLCSVSPSHGMSHSWESLKVPRTVRLPLSSFSLLAWHEMLFWINRRGFCVADRNSRKRGSPSSLSPSAWRACSASSERGRRCVVRKGELFSHLHITVVERYPVSWILKFLDSWVNVLKTAI